MTQLYTCTCAKLPQSCPALCDPMDCSPPGSPIHGLCILFYIHFHYDLSQERGYSSLACTEGLALYPPLCNSSHLLTPHSPPSLPPPPLGNHESLLYICEFVPVLQIVHLCHSLDSTSRDIIRCLSFSVWLTSLSMITLGPSLVWKRHYFILLTAE